MPRGSRRVVVEGAGPFIKDALFEELDGPGRRGGGDEIWASQLEGEGEGLPCPESDNAPLPSTINPSDDVKEAPAPPPPPPPFIGLENDVSGLR